jgi:hypothetical protein
MLTKNKLSSVIKSIYERGFYILCRIFAFMLARPYGVFFLTVYGSLLCKYYLNVKINSLNENKKVIEKSKEILAALEVEYNTCVYEVLKEKS